MPSRYGTWHLARALRRDESRRCGPPAYRNRAHDLGRLVLSEDTSDISHAEVSGVLAKELGEALARCPQP